MVSRYELQLLSRKDLLKFHEKTLELLENTGVKILCAEVCKILAEKGCIVDGSNLKIPRQLVEECLSSIPSSVTIYDRNGNEALHIEGKNSYFGMGGNQPKTYDLKTNKIRPSRLEDTVSAVRVADFCSGIDFMNSFAAPSDVDGKMTFLEVFRAMVTNTTKPIYFSSAGIEDLPYMHRIAATIVGGEAQLKQKPFIMHYTEPVSPLTHSNQAVNRLLYCADHKLPVIFAPVAMAGATAPITLAGALVQTNAENLSGLVIHQVRNPGAPIISGVIATIMDMQTSAPAYASPELRLTHSAFTQLYQYYQIPTWGTAGVSDSCVLDAQASMESALSLLMAALDGANLIHDVGYLNHGDVCHFASLVMVDEIISYVRRMLRGFNFDDEAFALDVIHEVGAQGTFIDHPQTFKLFRQEHWRPSFLSREILKDNNCKNIISYEEKVIAKTLEIIKTHKPQPLSKIHIDIIDTIVEEASQKINTFMA